MVIHGFDPDSPIVRQHPEFFCNEDGQIALHPEWKSATVDWATRAYRRYMAALARYHARNTVLTVTVSTPQPSRVPIGTRVALPGLLSGTASLSLLREPAAIRTVNPNAVLLNEVFGLLYYGVCDLAHDNMTMGSQIFLEKLARGRTSALDYKRHMQAVLLIDYLPVRIVFILPATMIHPGSIILTDIRPRSWPWTPSMSCSRSLRFSRATRITAPTLKMKRFSPFTAGYRRAARNGLSLGGKSSCAKQPVTIRWFLPACAG